MLILASQSPRRRDILHQAGIPFIALPANVDETIQAGESPHTYVQRVAREKATAIEGSPIDIVLGADTVVVVGGRILGKPRDPADALAMLEALSGREHTVLTGICLRRATDMILDIAETRVWFQSLDRPELERYVATGEPMDKAGAYAIQGLASKFIRQIEGSYTNVVGLPIELVYRHLRRWDHW